MGTSTVVTFIGDVRVADLREQVCADVFKTASELKGEVDAVISRCAGGEIVISLFGLDLSAVADSDYDDEYGLEYTRVVDSERLLETASRLPSRGHLQFEDEPVVLSWDDEDVEALSRLCNL